MLPIPLRRRAGAVSEPVRAARLVKRAHARVQFGTAAALRLAYSAHVSSGWQISRDVLDPNAVPYFNWDAAVTNDAVRRALRDGTEDDRVYWIARILREAQYADVWQYVSLRRDVLPRWETLRSMLGRRRAFWEFLVDRWRSDGLVA